MVYAVQSPFTGELHYPSDGRHWGSEKRRMKAWLEAWGSKYSERDLKDGHPRALLIKDAPIRGEPKFRADNPVLKKAREEAERIRAAGCWPVAHWRDEGQGTFGMKKYLKDVKQGIVPTTYWSDDDYDEPFEIGDTSWDHHQSGHSQSGVNELSAIMGRAHGFETVKPLRLFRKIIQIWCRPDGIVFDPFAGSGTTAHAVLELNAEMGSTRRFVLVEQGRPEKGDAYARTLTVERVRRAITGERIAKSGKPDAPASPLPGGFRFSKLTTKVDAAAVLALEREEMIDLLLTTHWDQGERASAHLRRLPAGEHTCLFAVSARGEGFFLIWNGPNKPSVLDRTAFRGIVEEAKAEKLAPPYHVYARTAIYPGPNIEFYQIPDRILDKLGFNETTQPYTERNTPEEDAA
jgi:adenine-specific DNA-methyltransferase